jgi:hypothetical protein
MLLMAKPPKKDASTPKKAVGRPRKYESTDAAQERSGTSVHVYIDPLVNAALTEYIASQVFRPSKTAVLELALREHLERAGFWPPKKAE